MSNIGNVYVADQHNHRIRKVTVSTGIITTIAGAGSTTYGGDGGDATSATLYYPSGVALDTSGRLLITVFFIVWFVLNVLPLIGNIYIGDMYNSRIRKVTIASYPRYFQAYTFIKFNYSFTDHNILVLARARAHHPHRHPSPRKI